MVGWIERTNPPDPTIDGPSFQRETTGESHGDASPQSKNEHEDEGLT
jgi:hypothetical protein